MLFAGVCMCAVFSPENLRSGEVKGLKHTQKSAFLDKYL